MSELSLEELESILIQKIKSMDERKLIKEIEDQIFSSPTCLELISSFQKAQEDYNFALKIKDSSETQKKQKSLYEAKLKLDSNKDIKEYNRLLSVINEPLHYLEFNLISLFQKGNHSC